MKSTTKTFYTYIKQNENYQIEKDFFFNDTIDKLLM